jgi:Predicted membrane protein (DUF2339)
VAESADDLRHRVDALERAVAALRGEVERLRSARPAAPAPRPPSAAAGAPVPVPPIAAPRFRPPARAGDRMARIEHLVGRYGVLALATLTTIAAVGTFVSWAAMHGLLGPRARVVLGLLLAAGLAGAGLRLRRREPSFGATLLALALAVTLVCAWAAGPGLHLVSNPTALALAVVASGALAVFARGESEQPLWCIGIMGAAAAPFVATDQSGSALALAVYGTAVGVAAGAGIGGRPWRYAERTLAGVSVVYATVLQFGTRPSWSPLLGAVVPIAIVLLGLLPATDRTFVRSRMRAQGVVAALAALAAALQVSGADARRAGYLAAAVAVVWLIVTHVTRDAPADGAHEPGRAEPAGAAWIDGAFVPVLLAAAAAYAWPAGGWSRTGLLATLGAVLAGSAWVRGPGASRDARALAAAVAALAANAMAPWSWAVGYPIVDALLAALLVAAAMRRPSGSWIVALAAALTAGGAHTWILMAARPAYAYRPFLTRESLAGLVVLAACVVAAWQGGRMGAALAEAAPAADRRPKADDTRAVALWATAAPWAWAFVWAHRELSAAWGPSLSTFAVVTLEAGVAVALVWVGRVRAARLPRHLGLLLAVVAAVRALTAVGRVESVSLRIASYLVVSAFLLGIAYWYRRRGQEARPVAERVES